MAAEYSDSEYPQNEDGNMSTPARSRHNASSSVRKNQPTPPTNAAPSPGDTFKPILLQQDGPGLKYLSEIGTIAERIEPLFYPEKKIEKVLRKMSFSNKKPAYHEAMEKLTGKINLVAGYTADPLFFENVEITRLQAATKVMYRTMRSFTVHIALALRDDFDSFKKEGDLLRRNLESLGASLRGLHNGLEELVAYEEVGFAGAINPVEAAIHSLEDAL